MANENETIRFGEYQMNGPFRFKRMVKAVNDEGSPASDMSYLKKWEAQATSARAIDAQSVTSLCVYDALSSVSAFLSSLFVTEINLAGVGPWLALRDAVISCNRVVSVPDSKFVEDLTLKDAFITVAFALDTYGRMCDEAERHKLIAEFKAGALDDAYVLKHALRPYQDFVCGRGSAWLAYIDQMGETAASITEADWWGARDELARVRIAQLIETVAGAKGLSESEASAVVETEMSLVAGLFDRYQSAAWGRAHAGSMATKARPADEKAFTTCREDGKMPFVCDTVPDQAGYCRVFGVSALASSFNVARDFEVALRKQAIDAIMEKPGSKASGAYSMSFGTI